MTRRYKLYRLLKNLLLWCDTCSTVSVMHQRRASTRIARNGFKLIAATLQERIESGELEVGRYLPTERELQEEFGASRSTVRRALAQLVESGVAENVPSKGVIASQPRRVSTAGQNIALIDGSTYVLRVMLVRLADQLRTNGMHLVHLGGRNDDSLVDEIEYASKSGFAGALVWPYDGFPDSDRVRAAAKQMPIVALDHGLRGVPTDLVTFDYFSAAKEATVHLYERGCRRIAITGMLDMLECTADRFSGYMNGIFSCGMAPNAANYLFTHTSTMVEPDTRNLERRLHDPDAPDGFVVMQDEFLPATVEAILRSGKRIPEDVKLITIGDDVVVTVEDRSMTAIALDWDAMSQIAVDLLFDRLAHPGRPFVTRYAPHRKIVRGLCGAPSTEWTPDPDKLTGLRGDLPIPRQVHRFSTPRVVAYAST